ncbi:hypothetical protein OUZ56_008643 [Daphnia magna]|uniref:THAP-type domain-containing protein n=1 Tax=Daphnia magna TaxID=35525 RepID=A0ABR0ADL2_9CRUS|nr:hypothetical protein OUZ56_008643 [Daphnia magna]
MGNTRVCCICGVSTVYKKKNRNSRSFFKFPNPNIKKLLPFDKDLLERRLVAWKEVVGTNYDNFPIGLICVCSDHFQSGKLQLYNNTDNFYLTLCILGQPANFSNVNDIDWIPSKNLDLLVANKTRNTENANDDHSQNSNDVISKVLYTYWGEPFRFLYASNFSPSLPFRSITKYRTKCLFFIGGSTSFTFFSLLYTDRGIVSGSTHPNSFKKSQYNFFSSGTKPSANLESFKLQIVVSLVIIQHNRAIQRDRKLTKNVVVACYR